MTAAPSVAERIKAARGAKKEHRDVDVVLDQTVSAQVEEIDEQISALEQEVAALDARIAEHEAEKERLKPDLRFSDPRPAEIDKQIDAIRAESVGKQEQVAELEEQRDEIRKDTLIRLRFDKMDGDAWAKIAAKYPARLDATIDRLSGYDYQATAREAAPSCGYALGEGDAREDLTAEDWAGLWGLISGREAEWIASALWEMNDFGPRKRVDAARKAWSDGSERKSS